MTGSLLRGRDSIAVTISRVSAAAAAAATAAGDAVPLPANRPLHLDDPAAAWLVDGGRVHVFGVSDEPGVRRMPLFGAEAGALLLAPPAGAPLSLVVVGVADDTAVRPVARAALVEAAGGLERAVVARLLDGWLDSCTAATIDHEPEDGVLLMAGEAAAIRAGARAGPARELVWISTRDARPFGHDLGAVTDGKEVLLPIPATAWIRAVGAASVVPVASAAALEDPTAWAGVDAYMIALLRQLQHEIVVTEHDAATELMARRSYETELKTSTYTGLSEVLGGKVATAAPMGEGGAILAALRVVGESQGIEIVAAPRGSVGARSDPVDAITRASGVRARRVTLEGPWYEQDVGPLLAEDAETKLPVAVVPRRRGGGYEVVDPMAGTRTVVTPAVAAGLGADGWVLYRPLPPGEVSGRDLLRFMWRPIARDIRLLAVFAVITAGISLLTPIVTKQIFSKIVPDLQRSNLAWMTALLVTFAIATFGFSLAQQLAILRIQGRASIDVQAALWDRVLDLPLPFFRNRSAGSLAIRVMGIEQIRLLATATVVTAVLAIPVGLANIVLAVVLDPKLGLFGALAIVLIAATMVGLMRYQIPRQRRVQDATTQLFGTTMQLVEAVGKLRVADAERRGFAEWGRGFAVLKSSFRDAQIAFAAVTSLVVAAPALGALLLFLGATTLDKGSLDAATFLAFNTAFIQALAAVTGLTSVATFLSSAVPLYEDIKPMLAASRETEEGRTDPGRLRGQIRMEHVSMRYAEDGPLVLDDVSFVAEPGEFVAFVGPSGAGKSSVMRVLLGFETPEVGAVRYDGMDLETLDPRALRRQMGVVVQTASLMPGDIFTNIVGARPLTLTDAWEAARIAGIAEDIEALPMGMYTFVAEGAGTFSGGQRQRLLIARAVVGRPRILLFDEATSALDNRTQAIVAGAIEQLRATRIVIAHRLSTVRAADRIVVIEAGRVAQQGTFDELIAVPGPFQRLARRQLA
jgi:NHLM bacteriocin system ABC transporter ATP-binding protein